MTEPEHTPLTAAASARLARKRSVCAWFELCAHPVCALVYEWDERGRRITELERENERLRAALRWYAENCAMPDDALAALAPQAGPE